MDPGARDVALGGDVDVGVLSCLVVVPRHPVPVPPPSPTHTPQVGVHRLVGDWDRIGTRSLSDLHGSNSPTAEGGGVISGSQRRVWE